MKFELGKKKSDKIRKNSFLILLILVILIRIGLFITNQPRIARDTGGYIKLANHISALNFSNYNGERTPGYPLIIVFAHMNLKFLMILQMLMGIIISIVLYKIMFLLTKNSLLSLISGLSSSLYLPLLSRETVIVTETTATFFIVLSFLFFLYFIKGKDIRKKQFFCLLLTGLFSSLAALTKPIFIIIPIFFGLFILLHYRNLGKLPSKKALSHIIIFSIPIVFSIGSWILIIFNSTGTFGLTTIFGFSLITKVDSFFMESAPKECKKIPNYEILKKIYIKNRYMRINKGELTSVTIWRARKEMQDRTGLTYSQVSKLVGKMAQETIMHAPVKYLKEVVKGWILFWKPMRLETNFHPALRIVSKYVERVLFSFLELFFLVFPLMYILMKKVRKLMKNLDLIQISFLILSYLVILLTSIGQALIVWSEPRFSIPIEPILIVTIIFILRKILFFKKEIVCDTNHIR